MTGRAVRSTVLPLVAFAAVAFAGCGRHEDQWTTRTGSPEATEQRAAYKPATGAAADEKQIRGCLSGANESFTLVEERTSTVYRLRATPEPEEHPNVREVFEMLKQNAGAVVQVNGERRKANGQGAPEFQVAAVQRVADSCPANLMGAVDELNRTEPMKVGMKEGPPPTLGSMDRTKPPAAAQPVNPAH